MYSNALYYRYILVNFRVQATWITRKHLIQLELSGHECIRNRSVDKPYVKRMRNNVVIQKSCSGSTATMILRKGEVTKFWKVNYITYYLTKILQL